MSLESQQSNYLTNQTLQISSATSDVAYQNMAEHEIEFRKGFLGIGSILQTILENSTRYNKFDNKHRISVLMYNRNYGVLKTLGVKVKFQKKGWVWWNKTDATEIRAGWDYLAYSSPKTIPAISLPNTEAVPSMGAYYLINPTENPLYGVPLYASNNSYAKRYNLYGWYSKRGSNELFNINIPGGLVPFKPDGLSIPSSKFKDAIHTGWNTLKGILRKSAPPTPPSLMNSNPDNYKFPVYSLDGKGIKYLSINDMEKLPKSYNPTLLRGDILKDNKIQTYVSPYEVKGYNTDMIDIPLDFSTVNISISTNPNTMALNITQIAKSLLTQELGTSFDVKNGSIFGAVKYNNQWRGVRINVKMKD